MGRQSSRIYWQGQDHKEMVTWDGTKYQYHDKAYIWNVNKFELVWEKLSLSIKYLFRSPAPVVAVSSNYKKIYTSNQSAIYVYDLDNPRLGLTQLLGQPMQFATNKGDGINLGVSYTVTDTYPEYGSSYLTEPCGYDYKIINLDTEEISETKSINFRSHLDSLGGYGLRRGVLQGPVTPEDRNRVYNGVCAYPSEIQYGWRAVEPIIFNYSLNGITYSVVNNVVKPISTGLGSVVHQLGENLYMTIHYNGPTFATVINYYNMFGTTRGAYRMEGIEITNLSRIADNMLAIALSKDGKKYLLDFSNQQFSYEEIDLENFGYIDDAGKNVIYAKNKTIYLYKIKTGRVSRIDSYPGMSIQCDGNGIVSIQKGKISTGYYFDVYKIIGG